MSYVRMGAISRGELATVSTRTVTTTPVLAPRQPVATSIYGTTSRIVATAPPLPTGIRELTAPQTPIPPTGLVAPTLVKQPLTAPTRTQGTITVLRPGPTLSPTRTAPIQVLAPTRTPTTAPTVRTPRAPAPAPAPTLRTPAPAPTVRTPRTPAPAPSPTLRTPRTPAPAPTPRTPGRLPSPTLRQPRPPKPPPTTEGQPSSQVQEVDSLLDAAEASDGTSAGYGGGGGGGGGSWWSDASEGQEIPGGELPVVPVEPTKSGSTIVILGAAALAAAYAIWGM